MLLTLFLFLIPLAIAPTIFATPQPANQGALGLNVLTTSSNKTLPSTVQVWPRGTGLGSSANLSALVPAHPPKKFTSTTSSGSNYYWVGGSSGASSTMAGVQGTIQVVSQSVIGCLSFWVSTDSAANIWGQVGYYICNGSKPVAFYQIWNLNTNAVLVTGTTSVSTGSHQFSMYLQSGTNWAYAMDGKVFGTYNMQASNSCTCDPIYALSEEGYVSSPYNPQEVAFTNIQVQQNGVWSSLPSSQSYGSSWGVAGNIQNPSIPADADSVGGSTSPLSYGTTLWNTATPTSTSSTTTSTSSTTSIASSSTTSAVQSGGTLQIILTITPSTNTPKSTEYFTVQVTDQYGNPIGGANVSLTVIKPNGKSTTATATTNSAGLAYFKYALSAAAPLGTYNVSAVASVAGYVSAKATGTFTVI